MLKPQANLKNIELLLRTSREVLYIYCENTKIKQVFINLIKNAIDSMENGGNIFLNVVDIEENIQIQIIDQGSGIPKDLLNRIGEPFYTRKDKGTGLGLLVWFQIIESHDGAIHVDSKVDVGTTFTITMPSSSF
ncbi:HAMP domain-containing sensor histidine kinase [Neobacillus vireti]|uniref:HAMP domain-containing sensor histidine kinase n=1 Tax=Bacillus sp. OTU2372 TaxID=3043858 RepID=UPI00313D770D